MKIGFVSLGCPKNLVDSEVMMGLSQEGGHTLTPNPSEADVLVVNTCAFIDSAKEESVNTILELAEFKKNGSCKRLVVTGCLGERYREELKAQIPEIDAVLGTGEVPEIVGAIEGAKRNRTIPLTLVPSQSPIPNPQSLIPSPQSLIPGRPDGLPTYLYDAEPRVFATPRHFAYIKVAEGCDYKCSFCIIPKLRGHYRSRPVDAIVREARSLAERGVRELILISQDTTFYGRDLGQGAALPTAAARAERRRRHRLDPAALSVSDNDYRRHPRCHGRVRQSRQVHRFAAAARVRRVLRRMKRPGTGKGYERLLDRIRDARSRRLIQNNLHRGIPRRDRRRVRRAPGVCPERRVRPRGRLHLLARGRHDRIRPAGRRAGVDQEKRRNALMVEQKRIVARAQNGGRHPGAGDGGWPLSRTRARLAGPSGRTGARHRPGGVFHGGRP